MTTATVTSIPTAPIQFTDATQLKKNLSRARSFQQSQHQQQRRHHIHHIGNYVIHKKTLGSGSMGTVKLAECLSDKDHQQYAVKIMPKVNLNLVAGGGRGGRGAEEQPKNKDPKDTPREREQRTIREMAIMHLLRHPNICQLKEWVVHGEHYYMFLEFIEGGQLLDYIISHGKLREKLARKFARQIVSALDYCHRNSIVHRDLKIENILITNNEEIKIIDFGLSNIYSPSRLLNTFCGSLYFAAPELLQARNYTGPEVDVWSFGVVLYVLVCGRVPFDDTSLPALHQKIKAGVVEYPDHLSKDCVDLLSKILVVDPTKRETLSFVIHHPWMNKGYGEPILNYLPHRQPLKSIDLEVIRGMQGFGLGSPEEIETKLEQIISSPEYQYAATQIDQNYQHYQQQQQKNNNSNINTNTTPSSDNTNSLTRWRRTISIRRTAANTTNLSKKDDPQSLPAMYDPLISIYSLVKERREFDEKIRLLESGGYQSPVQLGRSASTSLTTKSSSSTSTSDLRRRRTERVPPSHTRNIFKDDPNGAITTTKAASTNDNAVDWAASNVNNNTPKRSNSLRAGGTNLLQRSRSAVKRIGAMLPSSTKNQQQQQQQHEDTFNVVDNHRHRQHRSRDSLPPPTTNTHNNNRPVSPELSYSSSLKKKTIHLLRSNSSTDKRYREQSSAKKPTSSSSSSANTASGLEDEGLNKYGSSAPSSSSNQSSGGRFIEEGMESIKQQQQQQQQVPKMSAHPKSLFNFNRRHLFKMTTSDMMKNIQQVLLKLDIRYIPSPHEPYTLKCELLDWQRFKMAAHNAAILDYSEDDEGLVDEVVPFTVMIYQARWAGGRLGIKVIEAEEKEDKAYRHIYHTILNELGTF